MDWIAAEQFMRNYAKSKGLNVLSVTPIWNYSTNYGQILGDGNAKSLYYLNVFIRLYSGNDYYYWYNLYENANYITYNSNSTDIVCTDFYLNNWSSNSAVQINALKIDLF